MNGESKFLQFSHSDVPPFLKKGDVSMHFSKSYFCGTSVQSLVLDEVIAIFQPQLALKQVLSSFLKVSYLPQHC